MQPAISQPDIAQSVKEPSVLPDVIVIGAGAIGCATAWHLHQQGLSVQVLEAQPQPATQTTRAAAGFVCLWSEINNVTWHEPEHAMQRYGIDFYRQLAQHCGRDIGFYPCGIAYIATTAAGWARMQQRAAAAQQLGTPVELLDARRAQQLLPFVNYAATQGIVFDSSGVRIRASDAIPALATELANAGVDFRFNVKVTGFAVQNGRILGVQSEQRVFPSQRVVIAAGAWSRSLLSILHIPCPTTPVVQSRFVTQPIAGVDASMPMLIFPDCHGFYIREEHGGLLIGGHDDPPLPPDRTVDAEDPPFTQHVSTNQAYRARDYLHKLEEIMPILREAKIDQIATGLPTMTDDTMFIVDQVPGYEGLYAIAACQYAGVTHGPALGKMMTELIINGTSSWDRSAYRLDRFSA